MEFTGTKRFCYFIVILSWPQSSLPLPPISLFPNSAHLRRVVTCCLQILFSLFFFFLKPTSILCLSHSTEGCHQGHQWPLWQTPSSPYLPCLQHLTSDYSLFKTLFPGLPGNLWTFLLSSGWSSSVFATGSSSSPWPPNCQQVPKLHYGHLFSVYTHSPAHLIQCVRYLLLTEDSQMLSPTWTLLLKLRRYVQLPLWHLYLISNIASQT